MYQSVPMVEIWRGNFLETIHEGHAVVCDPTGKIVKSWGNPSAIVLPRSSSKMLQALPLIESGAADAVGLTSRHLALACASHSAASIHTELVSDWLSALGFSDSDLRCGVQEPFDIAARDALIHSGDPVCQLHNNCSGKHTGFLTLSRHIGASSEYIEPDHPVQLAVREAFDDMTGLSSPGFSIDGCSAPNFATSILGMARAMAIFAVARDGKDRRLSAAARLREAMAAHPEYVAGEGRACTELMRALGHGAVIKTGAEGYFVAMLPQHSLGVALKVLDGKTAAAEAALAALLIDLGALDVNHPTAKKYVDAPLLNRRGVSCGSTRIASGFV